MKTATWIGSLWVVALLSSTSAVAADITIDARALSETQFSVSGVPGCLDGSQVQTVALSAGAYTFAGCGTGIGFAFSVGANGLVSYDPGFEAFLDGAGTSALVVHGFPITIDARGLTDGFLLYLIYSTYSCDQGQVRAFTLLPGEYRFQGCSSSSIELRFTVGPDGKLSYDPSLEPLILDGAGTSALVVHGFPITIDARGLTDNFYLYNITNPAAGCVDQGQVRAFTLLPGEYQFLGCSSSSLGFRFTVGPDGKLSYDPSLEQFILDGAGTSALVVHGFPVTIDARTLTDASFNLFRVTNCLDRRLPRTLSLLPGPYTFLGCAAGRRDLGFSFTVGNDGGVDYDPALDTVLSGRGSLTLVVLGVRVIIAPDQGFSGATTVPDFSQAPCEGRLSLTLLQGTFGYTVCVANGGCYPFLVSPDLQLSPAVIDTTAGRLLMIKGPAPIAGDPTAALAFCDVSQPAFIEGTVSVDLDNSCSQNSPNETPVGKVEVIVRDTTLSTRTYHVWTDDQGTYTASVQPGSYAVQLVHNNRIQETCNNGAGLTYNVTLAGGETSSGDSFSVVSVCDAEVTIVPDFPDCLTDPCTIPRTGTCPRCETDYFFTYKNNGTPKILAGALLSMHLPSAPASLTLAQPITVSGIGCTLSPPSGTFPDLTWTLQNDLNGGNTCKIYVAVTVNACNDTTTPGYLYTTARFFGPGPPMFDNFVCYDGQRKSKEGTLTELCQCSCDPNDKTVEPAGCGLAGSIVGNETLEYMIRFQNIGTTAALNVVVRDVVDPSLDVGTMEIVSASHPYTKVEVRSENLLVWTFAGINLPDSTHNEPGSHGFVVYRIKPRASLVEGTQLINSAAIYFDDNPPVITNVTLNTVAPSQFVDQDADGFTPCAGDCSDTNPSVHPGARELCDGLDNDCDGTVDGPAARPQEVTGLAVAADGATLSWGAAGASYGLLRGALTELPVGNKPSETCLASGLTATTSTDASVPAVGRGFWYLVRAVNACGTGTYGSASGGAESVSAACP